MLDSIQVGVSVLGSLAAVVSAVVAIRQWRLNSDSDRRPPTSYLSFRRLTRPLSILGGALILALVSTLLLLQAIAPGESAPPEGTRILMQLKSDAETNCRPVSPVSGAIAALSCSLREEPISSVTMSLFPTVDALERSQREKLNEVGTTKGNCFSQTLAWEEWDKGILLCDYENDKPHPSLQWSRRDSRVLVQATAAPDAEPGEIYLWWRADSTGSPANNRLPYPDAIENYILNIADRDPDECKRASQYRDSLGAVKCRASVPDFLFLAYYGDDSTLRHSIYAQELTDGSCVEYKQVPAVKRYEVAGEEVGLRQCYEDSDERELIVKWFNEDTRIFGFAEVDGSPSELQPLFRWWLEWGRFLTAE